MGTVIPQVKKTPCIYLVPSPQGILFYFFLKTTVMDPPV